MFQRVGLVPVLGMVLVPEPVLELEPVLVPELVPEQVSVLVRHRRQQ